MAEVDDWIAPTAAVAPVKPPSDGGADDWTTPGATGAPASPEQTAFSIRDYALKSIPQKEWSLINPSLVGMYGSLARGLQTLPETIASAFTAPQRAMTGELDTNSPEAVDEALNMAMLLGPKAPAMGRPRVPPALPLQPEVTGNVPPSGPAGAGAAAVHPATQAAEFDIPLSRGQAEQDMGAIRYEDMASKGAYGEPAQQIAKPWFERQFQKIGEAGQGIGERLAGEHPVAEGPGDAAGTINADVAEQAAEARRTRGEAQQRAQQEGEAQRGNVADQARSIEEALRGGYQPIENVRETGEVVANDVRAQAAADRNHYRNLYNEAFALPGEFHASAFEGIGQRIKGEISGGDNPVIIDDVTTPVASRAIRDLDNISNLRIQNRADPMGAPNPENIVGVDLRGVDQARKRLVAYYQAARSAAPWGQVTPDVRAMDHMLDAFDNQVEHAISNGLFSGDERALGALREARTAYRNYVQKYRPRGSGDDVGTAIRRIVDRQATPEETANIILGSGRIGNAGLPVRLADRLETILGADSDGWSTIRQAMWQRASQVRNAAGEVDPVRSAANIEQFADSSLGRRMFQPYELNAMRGHAQALRQLDRTIETLPETAAAEQAARGYETMFGGAGIGGAQQAVFRRIVEGVATPEETAGAVFGAIGSGNPGNAARMIDAIERIAGSDSQTMSAMRQGVWQRLTQAAAGKDQPGAQKLAQNINEFLNGRGRTISERLYSPDELALMQRYADVVKRTVIPKYARTNSDTAPAMAAMVRRAGVTVSSMLLSHIPLVGRLAHWGVEKMLEKTAGKLSDAAEARKVSKSLDYSTTQAIQPPRAKGGRIETNMATRRQSHYDAKGGTAPEHCSNCMMFRKPHGCSAVSGFIAARGKCDWFKKGDEKESYSQWRERIGWASGGRVLAHYVDQNPTDAQKKAGNYRKAHITVHGLDIAIENPRGSMRRGVGRDGKPWAVRMPAHYGYLKGSMGADKDHVDCYIGPHVQSRKVFIVDQRDAETKSFDEHKCMIGYGSAEQARAAYLKGFSDDKSKARLGHMREMDIDQFKDWLKNGDTTKPAKAA